MKNKLFLGKILRKKGKNPLTGANYEAKEEVLSISAKSKSEAKEKALANTKLELTGAEIEIFIDGDPFFDPRW